MESPHELLAAIDADPGALEPRRVLGDWYLSQGDPLGELIAVQVAMLEAGGDASPELRAREQALFEQHRERLFGPLREPRGKVEWFAGSWRAIALEGTVVDLPAVLGHPLARWVSGLSARQTLSLDKLDLPTIRELSLESLDHRTQILPSGRRQPRLGSFRFEGSSVRLIEPPPLGLSQLRLKGRPSGPLGVNSLPGADEIARVSWPVLLRLSVEAVLSDAALAAIFDGERFPRLTQLRLQMLGPGAWDVLAHVKRPPPLRRLELLDPNFRRPTGIEWLSRAFPLLGNIESVQLLAPRLRYDGAGAGVLRDDVGWTS